MTSNRCRCGTLTERPGPCARCESLSIVCGYCLRTGHSVVTCPDIWREV